MKNVVEINNGILFNNKKEENPAMCNNYTDLEGILINKMS